MDEQSLNVTITANGTSAITTVESLEQRLSKLEAAWKRNSGEAEKAGNAVEKVGSRSKRAAVEAEEAGGAFSKLAGFLRDLSEHSRTAGMALNSMGLHAEAAEAKMSGVAQLFDGFGKAVPGLLAAGAALGVVAAAGAFLKDAAAKAAAWQQNMDILGRTVRDQGANWNIARKAVVDFADAQERATTYSRDDVVKAVTQMTSAGMNYKDAMAEVRVAEDASAATGQSLMTVAHGLVEATHGRTQALTMLGIGTKQSIHAGMTLYAMNAAIEKQMGGSAAAAAEGYAGKMTQLHNVFESLQEKIGSAVLPALTAVAEALIKMVDAAEAQFAKWENAAQQFYLRNKAAFDALGKAIGAIWTFVKMNTQAMWAEISDVFRMNLGIAMDLFTTFGDLFTGHANRLWSDVGHIFTDAWHNLTAGFGNFGDNMITMAERIAKAIANVFSHIAKASIDFMTGNIGAMGADMQGALSGFSGITGGLKPWTFGSGGATHESNANPLLALSAAAGNVMAGGPAAGGHKGAGHHGGHAGHHGNSAAAAARKAEAAAIREVRAELQRHIATIDLEQKKHQITIAQEIADLKKYESTHKLTADERIKIEQKIQSLEQESVRITQEAERKKQEAIKKTEEAKKREAEAAKKAAEQAQREAEKQQAQWEQYYKSLEQNAQQWTDKTATWIEAMFAHGKKHAHAFADEFKAILKQIEEALLKSTLFEMFMGAQGAKGGGFMAEFAKNMGFGQKGASAPMLGGKSGGALSGIASMFGGGKSGASADGTGGIIGALIGTSAASQLASSLPTDSLMSLMFGVGAPSMTGSSGGAGSGGIAAGGLGGAAMVLAGGSGPGGGTIAGNAANIADSSISSALGKGGIKGLSAFFGQRIGTGMFGVSGAGATLGSTFLGAAGGYLVGTGVDATLFHNQPLNHGGQIGGAIGGAAGSIFGPALDAALGIGTGGIGLIAGPLLGALGGSILGGLFGNHDNPANMPDKYDTQNYLAAMSTLNGNANWHANGQTIANYSQDQQSYDMMMSASGGQSGISWIEKTLAQYAQPGTTQMGSNTPQWLQPLWNQLVSAFGVSSTGSGQMNWGHAINNEWITGAQGVTNSSGSPLQYTDFENLLNQFYQNYMTQGQIGVSGYNNPAAPNFNGGSGFSVTSPFAGAYTVGTPGSAPQLVNGDSSLPTFALNTPGSPSGGSPADGGINKGNRVRMDAQPAVNVTVNVQGNVTAENDLTETIRQKITDHLISSRFSNHMALGGVGGL